MRYYRNNLAGNVLREFICISAFIFLVGLVTVAGCSSLTGRSSSSDHTGPTLEGREAEVKSNLHAIQIALERYAVDTGGFYPLMLYGGDATDTFAKLGAPDNPDTGQSYYMPPDEPGYRAFPGDSDALIQFGYLAQYPTNPFVDPERGKIVTNPGENGFGPLEYHFTTIGISRVNIWSQPFDRSLYYVRRSVGGRDGNLMWDVSEGQRHPPWPIIVVPEPERHWSGFTNPEPARGEPRERFRDDYQFWLTPGNFYYYAIFEGNGSYSAFAETSIGPDRARPMSGPVIGFHLCAYGDIQDPGLDVYNLWGDFAERSLRSVNDQNVTTAATMPYVGPDGRRDGVVMVLDSGVQIRQ